MQDARIEDSQNGNVQLARQNQIELGDPTRQRIQMIPQHTVHTPSPACRDFGKMCLCPTAGQSAFGRRVRAPSSASPSLPPNLAGSETPPARTAAGGTLYSPG